MHELFNESLRTGRSGDQISVGERFSAPVQAGPVAHPGILYSGYWVFPEGKAARTWRWPPTPSSAEVKERVELYSYSLSAPSWPVVDWDLPFTFYRNCYFSTVLTSLSPTLRLRRICLYDNHNSHLMLACIQSYWRLVDSTVYKNLLPHPILFGWSNREEWGGWGI